jgi:hypothetical protein
MNGPNKPESLSLASLSNVNTWELGQSLPEWSTCDPLLGRFLALPAYIRLGCKKASDTNALVYFPCFEKRRKMFYNIDITSEITLSVKLSFMFTV